MNAELINHAESIINLVARLEYLPEYGDPTFVKMAISYHESHIGAILGVNPVLATTIVLDRIRKQVKRTPVLARNAGVLYQHYYAATKSYRS